MGNHTSRSAPVRAERAALVHNATAAAASQVRAAAAALPAPPAPLASTAIIAAGPLAQHDLTRMALDVAARQLDRGDREFTKADLVAIAAKLHGIRIDDAAALFAYQSLTVGELRARIRLTVLTTPLPAPHPYPAPPHPAPFPMPQPSAPPMPMYMHAKYEDPSI